MNIAKNCLDLWEKRNYPEAKFNINEIVVYKGKIHKVLGMNDTGLAGEPDLESSIEYIIDNHDFLVWEFELKKITN